MWALDRIAEIAATAVSLFLSGAISSISMVTIPVAISTSRTDETLLQQWKAVYLSGHRQGPMIATFAALAHVGIAYSKWTRGGNPTLSVLAAIFTAGIVPYTWTVMVPTNTRLMNSANTGSRGEDARSLINRWKVMNNIRGLLPMVGGICGLIKIAN